MEGDAAEEMLKLFKRMPKESFELLLRNIKIRDSLMALYEKHSSGLALSYEAVFEEVFNNFLRPILRPLEAAIHGVRALSPMLDLFLDPRLAETQSEVARAYADFIKSWLSYLRQTISGLLSEATPPISDVVERFLKGHKEIVEKYVRMLTNYPVDEFLFLLPKGFFTNLEEVVKQWEAFLKAFEEYRALLREAYVRAAEAFIEKANTSRFSSYREFIEVFLDLEAQALSEAVASAKYLETQRRVLESLMSYVYHYRRFFEEVLASNPANPFATVSLLDEAFRRVADLRRRVRELERRVAKVEEVLRGACREERAH